MTLDAECICRVSAELVAAMAVEWIVVAVSRSVCA